MCVIRHLTRAALLTCFISSPTLAEEYFSNLLSLIKPPHSHTALYAKNLVTDQVVFEQNADTLLLPASTQKLLTAVAATAQLGDDFTFNTELYSRYPIRNGKVTGDIFLTFSGDPTLTTQNLRGLFKQLEDLGVSKINGDLYLVGNSNEQLQAPGWVWDDLGICFAAPVSQFVINQNCVHGQLKPMLASNKSQLSFASYLPVKFYNSAIFDKNKQELFCDLDLKRLANNQFQLSGCYPGSKNIKLAVAISDPALFASDTLKQIIASSKIKLTGSVKLSNVSPNNANIIAKHSSQTLPQLLETMLLKSDNLIADSLLKQIGQSYYKSAGSFKNGSRAMRDILTQAGVDLTHAQIVDGSGLSRYNLLSAKQLSQVLGLIYTDKRFMGLLDSLPLSGVSGTLQYKSYFNRKPLVNYVYAKTGSMQGVDNLAGFIKKPYFDDTLFVVLENGQSPLEKKEQIAPFSALFLQTLLDYKPNNDLKTSRTTSSLSH
ncbi:D-alanyl-D-alanine carboxypeptidase/D-alanyl-D-alanine endopeptidase [Shewanella woodyi]|uniref:D-alanyl-D-alanine carboxypeptidase/D-alanyl-D-alanine endopeptidase n=1 Tax=Shewanella woodyi TaxID=60961 RepID=UPI00374952DD